MVEIVRFDIGSHRVETMSTRIIGILEGLDLGNALTALCLSACYFIDHLPNHDDKQAVYEAFIREMAKVMAAAPGVAKS